MTVYEIYKSITKHKLLILIICIAAAIVTGIISFYFLKNEYQASATIIVSSQKAKNGTDDLTYDDYTLNLKLVSSYQVLCKTDRVLNQVLADTKLPMDIQTLADKITVTSQEGTEIIRISVVDESPALAQEIANSLANVFQKEVINIMKMDNVQVIDCAVLPKAPIRPDRVQIILLGIIVALLLGIGLSILLDLFDTSIKGSDQVEELLQIPVLGTVPHME